MLVVGVGAPLDMEPGIPIPLLQTWTWNAHPPPFPQTCGPRIPIPPPNRMTDTCENITFRNFVGGGKNYKMERSQQETKGYLCCVILSIVKKFPIQE